MGRGADHLRVTGGGVGPLRERRSLGTSPRRFLAWPARPEVVTRDRLEESGVTCGRASRARGPRGAPEAFALPTPLLSALADGLLLCLFIFTPPRERLGEGGPVERRRQSLRTAQLFYDPAGRLRIPVELDNTGAGLLKWSLSAVPLRAEHFLFPVFLMSHQFPV